MIRRTLCRLAMLALLAAAPASAVGVVNGAPPRLTPLTFDAPADGPVEFRGAFAITPPNSDFGGLSGVEMIAPRTALAITDRAHWARLDLTIDNGRLTGVDRIRMAPMLDGQLRQLEGGGLDSEDLTYDPATGAIWVSFEADHRIWRYNATDEGPVASIRHPAWKRFSVNTGLEGLARDDQGRLWAIKEGSGGLDLPFPIFIRDGSKWTIKALPRPSPHHVTGAAFGPDGWLYVTERDFSFTSGFDFRLRRFRYGDGPGPEAIETLIELPSSSGIDNIEGVAVWKENGETLILLVSDDNMFILQRNVIALFALRP